MHAHASLGMVNVKACAEIRWRGAMIVTGVYAHPLH